MSAARRRKPSVRPTKNAPSAPASQDDDLPELEPIEEEFDVLEPVDDELPELEPIEEDSAVKVSHGPSDEEGFDVRVDVVVADMAKAAVLDAVRGPLERLAKGGDALRFRKVVVAFGGEAVIGSAVKALVAETLAGCRPLQLVVRRGFGDELVHEGELPTAAITASADGDRTKVSIDDTSCPPKDVAFAIAGALAAVAAEAEGKHVDVSCTSGAAPHRTTVAALDEAFATAKSLRIDGEVRFDRELEARVTAEAGDGSTVTIHVDVADDDATMDAALELALPRIAAQLAGKRVVLHARDRALSPAHTTRLIEAAAAASAAEVRVARRDDEDDVVLPLMLRTAAAGDGARAAIQVRTGDRGQSAVLAAFRREAEAAAELLRGREVTVDWPEGYALDAAVEAACIDDVLAGIGPRSIACSFGGQEREPFWPLPVQIDDSKSPIAVRIGTEAGKPVEVLRAIERRVAPWAATAAGGKDVRVTFEGQGNVSRSMAGRIREIFEQAGAARLEAVQDGATDVILPSLLTAAASSDDAVSLRVASGGRTPEQVDAALTRELDAAEWPADGAFRIDEPGDLADRLARVLAERGASRVVVGSAAPVQVHPSLFGPLEVDGARLTLHACPSGEQDAILAQIEREVPLLLGAAEDVGTKDVVLAWAGARRDDPQVEAALSSIRAAGPQRVLLASGGRPRQVHPEIVLDYVSVLGRRDAEEAGLILVGIDVCPEGDDADSHRTKVLEKLGLLDVDGRRALLIGRDEGEDLPIEDGDPLFDAVAAATEERAAATLTFRGADRHGRPHFVVRSSKLDALPVGTRVGDPRPSSRA